VEILLICRFQCELFRFIIRAIRNDGESFVSVVAGVRTVTTYKNRREAPKSHRACSLFAPTPFAGLPQQPNDCR
jgi:hypothetical protein